MPSCVNYYLFHNRQSRVHSGISDRSRHIVFLDIIICNLRANPFATGPLLQIIEQSLLSQGWVRGNPDTAVTTATVCHAYDLLQWELPNPLTRTDRRAFSEAPHESHRVGPGQCTPEHHDDGEHLLNLRTVRHQISLRW
jgi:hypothetical protein